MAFALLKSLLPAFLRKAVGEKFLVKFDEQTEIIDTKAKDAIKVSFVREAPSDALDHHGWSRSFERFPGEGDSAYRARLLRAFDWWSSAGTANAPLPNGGVGGLVGIITAYLGGAAVVEVHPYNEPWRGPGHVLGWWSHFWVVLKDTGFTAREYGSPTPTWGDGGTWGSSATEAQASTVKRLVQLFKGAHEVCPAVLVVLAGKTYGSPPTWGTGTFDSSAASVAWPIP